MKPKLKQGASPTVIPLHGEPWRYHVRSRTNPAVSHLVDLQEREWNGECSCEHFRFTVGPKLDGGAEPSIATTCWHIRQAMYWSLKNRVGKLVDKVSKTK
jgi:hypothetical protein